MTRSKTIEELVISVRQLRMAERYEETIQLAKIGFEEAMLEHYIQHAIAFLNNELFSYIYIGDYRGAVDTLARFEKLCVRYPSDLHLMSYNSAFGVVYAILHRNDDSKAYLLKAQELADSLQLRNTEHAHIYSNLCNVCLELNDLDGAVRYGLEAVNIIDNFVASDNKNVVPIKTNIIEALAKSQQLERAKQFRHEIEQLLAKTPRPREQALLLSASAWIHYGEHELLKAIELTERAKATYIQSGDKYMIKGMTRNLIRFYKELGNKDRVIELQERYIRQLEDTEQQTFSRALLNLEWQDKLHSMEQQAYIDPLTAVHNRRYLQHYSDALLQQHAHVGCLLFDIDHFKQYNDRYGHLIGDEIVKLVAATANTFIQQQHGLFVRFGGDEFVALVPIRTPEHFVQLMEQLIECVRAAKFVHDGNSITTTISMGGATTFTVPSRELNALLHAADVALYDVKEHGRNHYRIV